MATISEALDAAVKFHQTGDLAAAERLYREILQRDVRHADAWHLLGLVAYAQGDFATAAEQIAKAIDIDPTQPTFHNHLAEAYRPLCRLTEAEASCRQALALQPEMAIAHNTLGTVLDARGDAEGAMLCYRRAIALKGDFAQAQFNLGLALHARGEADLAIVNYRQALTSKPDYPLASDKLSKALIELGRVDEAIAECRKLVALRPGDSKAHCRLAAMLAEADRKAEATEAYARAAMLDPTLADAHFQLGVLHQNSGRLNEAAECYRRAILAQPDYAEAHSNLGTVYKAQGKLTEAMQSYEASLRCQGDLAEAHSNLGSVYKSQGKLSEAMQCYDAGLRYQNDLAEAHHNRGLLRLLQGDFEQGWPEYEWRLRVHGPLPNAPTQPRWQGQAAPDASMLLIAEQGLGDTIQFVRYAAMVQERFQGRVVLHAPAALHELLRGTAGVDRIVSGEVRDETFDFHAPLMSLPGILGTTVATIPGEVPYLTAQPQRVYHWRRELARLGGFRIGIAWQGAPGYAGDAQRSVPLAQFAPLAQCPGVRLFSLQKWHGLEQLPPLADRMGIVDLGPIVDEGTGAFVDTAAVMKGLDLVITSDTAIAHLAGALGVPVWVALPEVPDWRWLLNRDDSPWYPTMRLFRQARGGDWGEVFSRMASELRSLVAAHQTSQPARAFAIVDALETAERLRVEGRLDEAERQCREILAIDPVLVESPPRAADRAQALNTLGRVLNAQKKSEEAAAAYRQAIALDPNMAQGYFNLGLVSQETSRWDDALASYRRAIALDPKHADAHNNMGVVLKEQGRLDEAMATFEQCLELHPSNPHLRYNRALVRLLSGDFDRGWPDLDFRLPVHGVQPPKQAAARWEGQPVPGAAILIAAEQGLGDMIQFVRYAALLKERSQAQVLLELGPRRLQALFAGVAGVDRFVGEEGLGQWCDFYIPLMSLPGLFGTTVATIPANVPYLTAQPQRVDRLRREVKQHAGFRVGIAWQGAPKFVGDSQRSMPLAAFEPLAQCAGVRLLSLQKGPGYEQLAPLARQLRIVDLGAVLDCGPDAFVDTAAAMKHLDLVITSDTAIAHLAGALGVPVWVALARVPDWRWLLDRDDSPWYPTMRLFRQSRGGDWGEVFSRMAAALQSLANERAAR